MAKRLESSSGRSLRDVLLRQAGRKTVLGVVLPVLDAHIANLLRGTTFRGLTSSEIRIEFEKIASQYLTTEYSTTYPNRQLSTRGCFILTADRYKLRPELVSGLGLPELEQLRVELVQSLQDATERRKADIARLDAACQMPIDQIDARRALVEDYLRNYAGNFGENFEIVSYAILREYFQSFGFRLQRFSTTRANDGGIDYAGGDCIYQVSTDSSLEKLESDLAKAPDIKRVVVRPEMTQDTRIRAEEAAQARIEMTDLLTHFVGWMLSRDKTTRKARHLQGVLTTALAEFRREVRAERGSGE